MISTDVLVVGGGTGGVAAALAVLRRGCRVVVTEETDWLGGQLTSQGVPPDEHEWIERFGCTRSYRAFREAVRDYYRRWYPLTSAACADPALNPGRGLVSRLCHEPRVAAAVIEGMLAPYLAAGRLQVRYRRRPVGVAADGERITAVTFGDGSTVEARYVLDATELGDLLPLSGAEHVTGFESRADTGEPSAPPVAQPGNQQAFTWVMAIEHRDGEDHTIDKPEQYDFWAGYRPPSWPDRLLSLTAPEPSTLAPLARSFVPHGTADTDRADVDLWWFRRILSRDLFEPGFTASDVTIVNWPMVDYLPGRRTSVSPAGSPPNTLWSNRTSRWRCAASTARCDIPTRSAWAAASSWPGRLAAPGPGSQPGMARIASETLIARLAGWGAGTVFGLPGDGITGSWKDCAGSRTGSGSSSCLRGLPHRAAIATTPLKGRIQQLRT